ncbi:hypothetical protein acdb102_14310 [Acidothermaceae bacterium B102]|nr:hypothetical protein acdb102_14310 [Acidothermaceae bacterium B102]
MSRYVIVGAGAVGATLAAELHLAGRDVVLVARGDQLAALRSGGLRYLRPDREHRLELALAGGPDEVDLRSGDVLVVAGKAQHTEAIVATWAWRPVKDEDGRTASAAESLPVLVLQNGLDSERVALRRFETVYGAVVLLPSSYLHAGEVVSPGVPAVGFLYVGRVNGGSEAGLDELVADLADTGFAAQSIDDVARWKNAKLLFNLGNVVDALYAPSALRDRADGALRAEGRRILALSGADVADLRGESRLDVASFGVAPVAGQSRPGSSTWQSLARGAGLETDFLNGEIVLLARLLGARAPLNAAVTARAHRAEADGIAPGSLDDHDLAGTLTGLSTQSPFVDAADLRVALASDDRPVLLDVRWALGDPHGQQHYLDGHLPGARFVDLDRELAGHTGDPRDGRHPLPDLEDLQHAARSWGIGRDSRVVVYDNTGGLAASRAWWLLRWAGLSDVRILDGGLASWTSTDGDVTVGPENAVVPGDVELSAGHLPTLTADQAAQLARTGVLLDARVGERYRGEVEPVDAQAGHIPGAHSVPSAGNLDGDGRLLDAALLKDRFAAAGATPDAAVGVYCGSGVTAAHEVAALAALGIDAALYPGSWSAWSADPSRPVATGPLPGLEDSR